MIQWTNLEMDRIMAEGREKRVEVFLTINILCNNKVAGRVLRVSDSVVCRCNIAN